jgi:hypothetical protein
VQKQNVVVSVYVLLVSSLAFSPEIPHPPLVYLSSPALSSLGLLRLSVFAESKRRQQQERARARSSSSLPPQKKENIGQREAVSALTTPQQRLHEREILIHKAASALRTPQERLHERELLIHQLSSAINKLLHNSVCLHERELLLIHKSSSAINSTRASKPAHMLEG